MRKPQAVVHTALRPFVVGANASRRGYVWHKPRYVSHLPARRSDGDVCWSAPVNKAQQPAIPRRGQDRGHPDERGGGSSARCCRAAFISPSCTDRRTLNPEDAA